MFSHKPDEVKTQMSRQKGDDNKLREKHTSTVSCDWSPNSGHIHWRIPYAVVQELCGTMVTIYTAEIRKLISTAEHKLLTIQKKM